ncbi:MAG: 30S ribosomal protein S8 [Candidatus Sungbacteria bacterium RIFCSPLOWO2_02_FULL_47_9]|uniref:Small ribosomal subunit protein uS8 n=1 Tax=Candidatus Sungbacteria bacterium RIFCSPHIGHO2_01_FULL_47_32 TaxID=1802264 RepID=A0A1G2K4L5_9BACT|nr:MAG: 30S ribosomal protein S8 [Parcubacteria group bacterium GW2011_GWA2_47_10]OGZ94362.1 MAG: 30S ribosomal protein S8 [Candidatus Sungbacteria bacterium RIFCSPHIGHO2_01_FULL_47_32]OGZ98340.1 MAG: 30S ribosomal protein S8 [Candidatus Sungbacteria bacterium RIFCSPHIGHO2_02_FULL_46_12]OHA04935.1 MAG: 30S ribosomal protein S8 [Candidatus Sungbacteria bacterium RIFCSPLOWO2_01_FULL_47_32]OHA12041.1 MAG: 30S ribosomal protein S8 [Candidatus Sungbacteria bacterium RIFCSPLOWO2_02_FULL_47_9]
MDPIADMITKIRNAYKAEHESVTLPFSNIKNAIAEVLERNKYISATEKKGKKARKFLELSLRYNGKAPAVHGIRRISKLGKRVYVGKSEIYSVKNGFGSAVISTSKGLMTDREAKKAGVGGEVILEVW